MSLSIDAEWERLERGTAEEKACFASIGIFAGEDSMTRAEDDFVGRVREKVHLSAYKLAEWFAWNWWRLRWEPKTSAPRWAMAHRMTTIGGGYVWPNITVKSDGELVLFVAKPTKKQATEPLHYIADFSAAFRAIEFEGAVSRFIEQVQGQLRDKDIRKTNLDRIWADVCTEKSNQMAGTRRRLEALLGFEPDEADEGLLDRLIDESKDLGESAIREIAVMSAGHEHVFTKSDLQEMASNLGIDANPRDGVRLRPETQLSPTGRVPAWKRGAEAAKALRAQENLDSDSISNHQLAEMVGVPANILDPRPEGSEFTFEIDETQNAGRIVLRPRNEPGRRFDLARLLGDRIAGNSTGHLFPVTRMYTYRQKLQRSFAAEFLCPFNALDNFLQGDYSGERQEEAADHYKVSPLTVRTLLVNHHRLERDELYGDYDELDGNY